MTYNVFNYINEMRGATWEGHRRSKNLPLPNSAETLACFETTDGFFAAGER